MAASRRLAALGAGTRRATDASHDAFNLAHCRRGNLPAACAGHAPGRRSRPSRTRTDRRRRFGASAGHCARRLRQENRGPACPSPSRRKPALRIDLQLTDAVVDIVGGGLDVAVRIAAAQRFFAPSPNGSAPMSASSAPPLIFRPRRTAATHGRPRATPMPCPVGHHALAFQRGRTASRRPGRRSVLEAGALKPCMRPAVTGPGSLCCRPGTQRGTGGQATWKRSPSRTPGHGNWPSGRSTPRPRRYRRKSASLLNFSLRRHTRTLLPDRHQASPSIFLEAPEEWPKADCRPPS